MFSDSLVRLARSSRRAATTRWQTSSSSLSSSSPGQSRQDHVARIPIKRVHFNWGVFNVSLCVFGALLGLDIVAQLQFFWDNFGQICTYGPISGHLCMIPVHCCQAPLYLLVWNMSFNRSWNLLYKNWVGPKEIFKWLVLGNGKRFLGNSNAWW